LGRSFAVFELLLPVANGICIAILVMALYYPRHKRHDLLLAYLAVNVGVLAVAEALAATSVNVGLGLGLFGVLAIIRLRSAELDHHEIAYYFASLALGLIGGLASPMGWVAIAMMTAIVIVMAVGDIGGVARRGRSQTVVLCGLVRAGPELEAVLRGVCGPAIASYSVRRLDQPRDETVVSVRLSPAPAGRSPKKALAEDAGAVNS
jgi:hypothetical protein